MFYRANSCSIGLPQQFPRPQIPNRKGRDDQQPCKEDNGNVSLLIIWCINLFPNHQWQPGLQDIRHLVHRCHYNCSLFVVFVADFMRPTATFISIAVSPCLATSGQLVKVDLRHAKTREPESTSHDVEASPFPANRNVPHCQRYINDDIHHPSEDDWWPTRTVQD
jgi:hypothetical protein